jgi:hypothetical protein
MALVACLGAPGCSDGTLELFPGGRDGGSDGSVDSSSAVDATSQETGEGMEAATDAPPEACTNGSCVCGLTSCPTGCFDLANDPSHCNPCAQGCVHNAYCSQSQCGCLPGFTPCSGTCLHLASDPNHCGGCNATPCAAGDKCENGTCAVGACSGTLTGCVVTGRTACVDLASGVPYCGTCGTVCGPDQVCVAGTCQTYAPATPCTACPCASDCARAVGSPATCCPGIAGGAQPICVHATACP